MTTVRTEDHDLGAMGELASQDVGLARVEALVRLTDVGEVELEGIETRLLDVDAGSREGRGVSEVRDTYQLLCVIPSATDLGNRLQWSTQSTASIRMFRTVWDKGSKLTHCTACWHVMRFVTSRCVCVFVCVRVCERLESHSSCGTDTFRVCVCVCVRVCVRVRVSPIRALPPVCFV